MSGTAVTIGAYDGVHLGHRALLADLTARAEAEGLSTVVVTFDRHPASVVRPESAPPQLTDLDQKLELLAEPGQEGHVPLAPVAEVEVLPHHHQTGLELVHQYFLDEVLGRLVGPGPVELDDQGAIYAAGS